jgi:hypothetical protein
MSAISYSEQLGVDVSDHITSYLATKPVTLPRWIKMQTLWRGDD